MGKEKLLASSGCFIIRNFTLGALVVANYEKADVRQTIQEWTK